MTEMIELRRDVDPVEGRIDNYVLKVENFSQQITRQPTVITTAGMRRDPVTLEPIGRPRVVAYDIGIVSEQVTLSGQILRIDEDVVEGDAAYEDGVDKIYPGKETLRMAVLTWWADGNWGNPPEGFVQLHFPVGPVLAGVIQSCQFNQQPGRDIFEFSLVFRVAYYGT